MKILMLTPYLPYPLLSGGQIRTFNLLKKLASKHDITLFALIKDDEELKYLENLQPYCKKIQVFRRSQKPFTVQNILRTAISSFPFLVIRNHVKETIDAVRAELQTADYDLIHAETFYMMPHIPTTNIPIILVEQTIEYLGYESFAKRIKLPFIKHILNIDINKIKKWEHYYWELCTKLIVMSEDDKQFIAAKISEPNKIAVVSNGVDTKWFAQVNKKLPKNPTLLFVGTFKWLPNVEAVDFLITKVWPLVKNKITNAQLLIVGNAPTNKVLRFAENDPQITVSGTVPDIRQAFAGAHVLVAPVFSGKGTRYKILEAMASRTPIVATDTAVEGLGVKNNTHVLVANTATAMAEAITKLVADTNLSHRLAENSHKFVRDTYDWSNISQLLDEIYRQLGSKQFNKHKNNSVI